MSKMEICLKAGADPNAKRDSGAAILWLEILRAAVQLAGNDYNLQSRTYCVAEMFLKYRQLDNTSKLQKEEKVPRTLVGGGALGMLGRKFTGLKKKQFWL
jgi:hypothetical protein